MFEDVLNLMLVGDEKSKVYCELMSMLISAKDDKKEKVSDEETKVIKQVGIRDGSIACQIMTEKNYTDTPTSSEQKFLFIGNTDASKKISSNIIKCDDNSFGVKMGWMGNKAIISVDYDVMKNDLQRKYLEFYNAYIGLYKQYAPDMLVDKQSAEKVDIDKIFFTAIEKKIESKGSINKSFITAVEKEYKSIGSKDNSKAKRALVKIGTLVAIESGWGISPIPFLAVELKYLSKRKQLIVDQMYRYGVLKFYLEHLEKFMKE